MLTPFATDYYMQTYKKATELKLRHLRALHPFDPYRNVS
jgi:hypothetical protein